MNLILSDAGATAAAQGAVTQGVANMAVAKNASGADMSEAVGQSSGASSPQGEAGFGDILGQVQNLLAGLAPANSQQAAPVVRADQPIQSMAPATGSGAEAGAQAADIESNLPAFMSATTVTRGKLAGSAAEADTQEMDSNAAVPAALPLMSAVMPNVPFPAALPGHPEDRAGSFGNGALLAEGQGRVLMETSGATLPGIAQFADPRAGASAATGAHGAAAMPMPVAEQTTPGVADAASSGLLAAQLPASNPPAATTTDTLRLPNGDPSQWRQTLGETLGERIVLERSKGNDQATIRLDPPSMGQIEISIRHEAGVLKVSIAATHTEVLNQLRGVGEALRQDLEQKHWGEVSVQVSQSGARLSGDDGRGGSGGGREQARRDPGRALGDENSEATAGFHLEGGEA